MTRRASQLCVCLLLLCCSLPLLAQDAVVPGMVRFAGSLSDSRHQPPLRGTVGVTFLLYKEQSGGTPLWMESQNVQVDKNGRFSVLLGSASKQGIPAQAFTAGEARWIAVQPSGQPEQSRVELVSVPYALKAADAQTLGGLPASAFLLATPSAGTSGAAASAAAASDGGSQAVGTIPVTTSGGIAQTLAKFDANADIANSQIFDNGTNVGIGTSTPSAKLDVKGSGTFRGLLTLPATGAATRTAGKNSQQLNFTTSAFNSVTSLPVSSTFRWQAEPVGNNTATPSGKLNLLFGTGGGTPLETGLSVSNAGLITFAPGQTFPGAGTGNGTVTSVGLSAPSSDFSVSGSPVTNNGTLGLQWLVAPTPGNAPNAIVKRDAFGSIFVGAINSAGITNNGDINVSRDIIAGRFVQASTVNAFSSSNVGGTAAVTGMSTDAGPESTFGVFGESFADAGRGVFGQALGSASTGVWGESFGGSGIGVLGAGQTGGTGVFGTSTSGSGVLALSTSGEAIFAATNTGSAGLFIGNVEVDGNLSKSSGSFKIDHPLDPANKYLYHSFVESPDMMNIYNGNLTTDAQGNATVQMPDWFEALNTDFRYQLTVIGQFAQAIVASKMSDRRFTIKTDKPNVEVSWQVTGIRHDAWANAHRIPVEEAKPDKDRGLFLHPELFGAVAEKSIAAARHPGVMQRAKEGKAN